MIDTLVERASIANLIELIRRAKNRGAIPSSITNYGEVA